MTETKWKATPKAKVYEAWSALADGRVTLVGDEETTVHSSDHAKTYKVVWTKDKKAFGANDNASYWVGYMGYPILAVVLHLGLVKYDHGIIDQFRNINWNKLNQIYKRRYGDVVEYVISQIEKSGLGSPEQIKQHADEVFSNIKALKLGRINPPGDPLSAARLAHL